MIGLQTSERMRPQSIKEMFVHSLQHLSHGVSFKSGTGHCLRNLELQGDARAVEAVICNVSLAGHYAKITQRNDGFHTESTARA